MDYTIADLVKDKGLINAEGIHLEAKHIYLKSEELKQHFIPAHDKYFFTPNLDMYRLKFHKVRMRFEDAYIDSSFEGHDKKISDVMQDLAEQAIQEIINDQHPVTLYYLFDELRIDAETEAVGDNNQNIKPCFTINGSMGFFVCDSKLELLVRSEISKYQLQFFSQPLNINAEIKTLDDGSCSLEISYDSSKPENHDVFKFKVYDKILAMFHKKNFNVIPEKELKDGERTLVRMKVSS